MSDYLDILSAFVAETRLEDLNPEAVSATKDVTLDTLGAIVAGSREPENGSLARLVAERSGTPTAAILGHDLSVEPMLAALVNATAGVALEMDEGNRFGGGHPAIHCLPGAIAVGEEMGASGGQIIESILVGYEVESRMGAATRARPNVHGHGHWGTVGTAASVAKLRGYDAGQIRGVINLAASMSPANSWMPAIRGATIRNLYPGRSGLQGILAAHLYECGFTGLDDAPSDVFGSIIGDRFDPEVVVDGLGGEYRIQQNYFKFYACCRQNHSSLEVVLQLRARERLSFEEVESVSVTTRYMHEGMVAGEYPSSTLGAKFNAPYAIAAALVRGSADVSAFLPEAIGDERIRDLASKVDVTVDPSLGLDQESGPFTRAVVRLTNGRALEGTSDVVAGDYGNRLPRQELLDKFHLLNEGHLGIERADTVIDAVGRLEQLGDVRELTSLLGGRS